MALELPNDIQSITGISSPEIGCNRIEALLNKCGNTLQTYNIVAYWRVLLYNHLSPSGDQSDQDLLSHEPEQPTAGRRIY